MKKLLLLSLQNMKATFFIVMCMIPFLGHPQGTERTIDELPTYQGVIGLPGADKMEIYGSLKEWIARAYNSANDVIQLDDPANGKLIVKGLESYNVSVRNVAVPNKCHHIVTLEVKPDKFRYTIEIIEVETGIMDLPILQNVLLRDIPLDADGEPYTGARLKNCLSMKDQHLVKVGNLKESLITSLMTVAAKKDDW